MARAIKITSVSGALTVTITGPNGGTPTVYADSQLANTLSMPATIADTATTSFWLPGPGKYTLSVKTSGGTEIAADNNSTRSVDLETDSSVAALNYDARTLATVSGDSGHSTAGSAASGVLTDKGNWVTATVYAVGDVVTNSNQRYVANTAHTSSAAFTTDVAKWTSLDPGALAPLSNNNPQADGTVGPGTGAAASRDDHVHPQASASATGSADPGLHGLAAWFGDPLYASSNFTPTAGVITFLKVRMAASTISNVILDVGGAGATVTGAFVGVYNSSGTRVGVSADISTTLQSTGIKTIPLTGAPISVTSGNAYVVAVIVTTAGTMPILRGFAGQNGMLVLGQAISSTFAPRAGTLSGQTSLPSTQAWTGLTATDNAQVTPQLALA